MERDPVCGMNVDPNKAAAKVEHAGKTFYFCAPGCAKRFQQSPESYLHSAKGATPPVGLVGLHNISQSAPAPPGATKTQEAQTEKTHASMDAAGAGYPSRTPPRGKTEQRYTCPMHPEIVRNSPGFCPICGMALEPMDVLADLEPDPEYDSMRLRFWLSAALSAPLLMLAMSGDSLGLRVAPNTLHWIELALATPVVLWGGWPFFQ